MYQPNFIYRFGIKQAFHILQKFYFDNLFFRFNQHSQKHKLFSQILVNQKGSYQFIPKILLYFGNNLVKIFFCYYFWRNKININRNAMTVMQSKISSSSQ